MSEFLHLKEWLRLPDSTKLNIYTETGRQIPLPAVAVEKDWWVVHTLALIFSMECAPSLIFKGGTSLSKAWNLIDRFSEDIDLVLDREFLGFKGELTSGDIKRLRRTSYAYLTTTFTEELKAKFSEAGFSEVEIKYREVVNHDQDPIIIEIYYKKLTETETYLKPGLLVEVGSRSLKEPFTQKTFNTLAGQNYADRPFADKAITIPVVNPERTFLEKVFLLHEEFQRPKEKIRVERLSRHLYDIEKLSKTEFAKTALANANLYTTIIAHRKKFAHISGVDYDKHAPEHINFIPPDDLLPLWEADYKEMQENMIYRESLPFVALIEKLSELQNLINSTKWDSAQSYKQTEVGLIPVDWEVKRLEEIATFSSGTTPRREMHDRYFLNGNIFWVKTLDLNNGEIVDTQEKVTSTALKETSSLKILPIDTVLVAMYGGFNQIGRTGLLAISACVNQALTAIKLDQKYHSPLFLINFLNYRIDYWKDIATSSRKDPNITSKDVKKFPISLPPTIAEQTAIATALSDADALISSLEKLIAKKRNIKQGAMQKLLEPKEGWEVKTYGDIFDFLSTASYSRAELTEIDSIGYVHYGDIHTKWNSFLNLDKSNLPTIPHNQLKGYHYLQEGDLIMADASEDYEGIGKSVEVLNLGSRKIISGLHTFLLRDRNEEFVNGFRAYIHNSKVVKSQLDRLATGLKVYGVSKANLKTVKIPIPPKKIQTEITSILFSMDAEINALETKLAKYRDVKLGMMQNLLTGNIRLV
ncbi:hypothetical protein DYBT9275_03719 [Dyadobacter sp. CECT 9275]|uniref:Type I restriction modification DNA specificity domain-containing protein n=1 Tax=Dyadobacter helix TaxID=2822344 RepID=A0A916JFF7_9BACT|nr:nucleotidyl transferase AbiEii/AbiGii toxin family protein [Dyadobacter sp. CECT 9275]CAG5006066.1 hypothetical protein DYBT9275_03719 [Dyadobacter sp. CECT 9275]